MPVQTPLGEIRRDGAVLAVVFEREYAAGAEEVWDAITTPERMRRWLGEPVGTLAAGNTVELRLGDSDDAKATVRIDVCDRPDRVEGEWWFPDERPTTLRVRLRSLGGDRTLVTLDHTGFPPDGTAGYGCGWHHYVDALDAHLRGAPRPDFADYYPALLDQWRAKVAAASAP